MLQFTTTIYKYGEAAEKTGWTFIEVPMAQAQLLKPGNKKAFRVKGFLDQTPFDGISLVPVGEGNFILPLKAALRKKLKKGEGATLQVQLQVDEQEIKPPEDLLQCLADEPKALAYFNKLPKSHQNYYIKWINEAKTEPTRTKRIAKSVMVLSVGGDFGAAVRAAGKQIL
jgi:hypothetical protein